MVSLRALCLVGAALVTGCASKPLPPISEGQYAGLAYAWLTIKKCGESGRVSPEIAGYAITYFEADVGKYNYEEAPMQAALDKRQNFKPENTECNTLAINVERRRQQIKIHNANVDQQRQETQNAINSFNAAMPKQTYCNRIGAQTLCSTY